MSFHRLPFVFLAVSLITGIVLQNELQLNVVGLSVMVVVSVILYFIRSEWRTLISVCALFLVLGVLISRSGSVERPIQGETTLILNVTEMKISEREWDQGVGEILYVRSQGEYIKLDEKLLFYTNSELIEKGMQLLVVSDISTIKNSNNPGSFNAQLFWRSKGISKISFITDDSFRILSKRDPGFMDRFSTFVRSSVIDALENSFSADQSAVLKALLLGDKGDLSTELRDHFANAGAMHLLAVSGLHVGIIAMILLFMFKQFPKRISNLWAHIAVVLILWMYATVTGFSPSVTRAVLMFSLLILSRLARGQYSPVNVLFFSAFIVVIWNPNVIYDIGFQLSYLAVLGIFLFYDKLESAVFIKNKVLKWIWQGTSIGLAAQITTAPLALYYFHQFPNYFALSNLGVMVMAASLMFISILFLITYKIAPIKLVVAFVLSFLVTALIHFVSWVDELPWSVAQGFEINGGQILLYSLGILLILSGSSKQTFRLLGAMLIIVFIAWIQVDRYHHLTSDHLIIFNSKTPLMMLRENTTAVCISTETELSKIDEMAIRDYLKLYPSDHRMVKLIPLHALKIGGRIVWNFKLNNDGIDIINEREHFTLTWAKDRKAIDTATIIQMPFMSSGIGYSLSEGAFMHQF